MAPGDPQDGNGMNDDIDGRHLRVYGRVQGVGFRAYCEDLAQARGLGGWVRNRRDGGVELLVYGPTAKVTEMIEACRRGPPGARVVDVHVAPATADLLRGHTAEFVVLP